MLARGRIEDLAEMIAVYDCLECDADLIFRTFSDGIEVKIAHDRCCPRWSGVQKKAAYAPSREDGS